MEDARALLNSIMGADRNAAASKRRGRKFTDDDICKKFLIGLCPHELFTNTKMDIGSCGKHHNDMLKETFEADTDFRYYRRKWNRSLRTQLKGLLQDVDRRAETNHSRIEREKEYGGGATEENKEIAKLKKEVTEKLEKAEALADDGKFDESRSLMKDVEDKKQRIAELEVLSLDKQEKESICSMCGLRVSADEAAEIARTGRGFHTDGKQHLGFIAIRKKAKELDAQEAQDRKDGIREPSPSPVKQRGDTKRRRSKSRSPRGGESRRRKASKSRTPKREDKRDGRRRRGSRSRSGKNRRRKSPTPVRRRSSSRRRQADTRKRKSPSPLVNASREMREKARHSSTPATTDKARSSSRGGKRDRSRKRHRDSSNEKTAKRSASPPPRPPSPPTEDAKAAAPPVRFVLGLGKLNMSELGARKDTDSKEGTDSPPPPPPSEDAEQQKDESDKEEAPPSPEPEKPKPPVRFVLGLGKLNISSLGRR